MARCRKRSGRRCSSAVLPFFLVLAGIALFLGNLNILPVDVDRIWECWPLIFVASGMARISRMRSPGAFLFGGILMVAGLIYTAVNLGLFHIHIRDSSWPISILFLAMGLAGLARVLDSGAARVRRTGFPDVPFADRHYQRASSFQPPDPNVPFLNVYAIMAPVSRSLDVQNFQGGKVTSIMGNVQLDLSRCRMADGTSTVYVEVHNVMGGIKLRVPQYWRVVMSVENTLGHFEDKTIPPNTGSSAPQFVVTGSCVMGTVEIDS